MEPDSEAAGSQVQLQVLYREGDMADIFPVLVADLQSIAPDTETQTAIADLHYWIQRGH